MRRPTSPRHRLSLLYPKIASATNASPISRHRVVPDRTEGGALWGDDREWVATLNAAQSSWQATSLTPDGPGYTPPVREAAGGMSGEDATSGIREGIKFAREMTRCVLLHARLLICVLCVLPLSFPTLPTSPHSRQTH